MPPSSQTCTCSQLAGECGGRGSELGRQPPSPPVCPGNPHPCLPSACAPPHLQTPSSSYRALGTGRAASGPRRCPRGNPLRSPCCWGCRAPRSTRHTRSPGRPSSLCLQRTGNRTQDPGQERLSQRPPPGVAAAPRPSFNPSTPVSPFFLATASVSASRAKRARRRKPRRCILGGEHGSGSPSGAAGVDLPPPFPSFQAQGVGLVRRRRRTQGRWPLAARRGARREASPPGAVCSPGRSSDPHPASSPQVGCGRGAEAAVRPPGPRALTRSLPALLRSLPRRARPAPAAAAPFVSRTGLSRSHGPPPPPPPTEEGPAPSPQTRAAPRPRGPRLRSRPAPPASTPASRQSAPHPPSPDAQLSRPRASVRSWHALSLAPNHGLRGSWAPACRPLSPLAASFPPRPRSLRWPPGGSTEPRVCHRSRRGARWEPVCGSGPRGPGAAFNPVEALLHLPGPLRRWGRSASPRLECFTKGAGRCSARCRGRWAREPRGSARVAGAEALRLSPSAGWRGRGLGS